ncbi:EAL and GGDEF domain-containing protein [Blastochloris viridis]|uniref:Cyclic di-GMP phosphodiesterase Gmr n=1 Tax=Blastochloris viridis TaxID=1079 RepID=A0A0H5BA96_BLAVI|nr:PAS-domain containing protein [Blastochloris viridis]ALK10843.1 Cyclic di-GMP phosphodiesterase Gmr [Blastochloris viridis]BAR99182.1 diguanylate cyclase/phosphodiesterase with PAS/PAC sensor [Blastochloris viridis]CUU43505.1 Cyclic di-GMP phosphodiesterase Gmr [Blastochloris viridis]
MTGIGSHGASFRSSEGEGHHLAPPVAAADLAARLGALDRTALVAEFDGAGRFVSVNDTLCRAIGVVGAALIGKSYLALTAGVRPPEAAAFAAAMAAGRTWRGDVRVRTGRGDHIWLDLALTPRPDAEGRVGCTAIGLDITGRKDTEHALRRRETLYRSMMMALGEGIFILDAEAHIISANPAAGRILGVNHEELIYPNSGGPRWDAVTEHGQPLPVRRFPAMVTLATGLPQRNVVMGLRGAGSGTTWVSVNSEPIFEAGSTRPSAVITSFTDITARKQAQEVLAEAVAAIPDGFAVYDDSDRLLMCNDAYRAFYAHSATAIRPGAGFEEILRYGLAHGQYPEAGEAAEQQEAWVAERLRLHRSPSSDSLQLLENGRWLQLRERRTPSGYTVGLRIDVSEIKRHAATLQAVVDNFPGGVSFFDSDLNLVVCNVQFRTLLELPDELFAHGLPTLEMIFRTNAERGEYGPGDPARQVRARLELARRGEPHLFERVRPDGTVVEIRGTPVPGGGFITTYVDMTARRAAEKLLSDSERRAREKSAALQITLAHMSQGLTMFDADGKLKVWNDRVVDMYGLPSDVMSRGASFADILKACQPFHTFDDGVDTFVGALWQELAQGNTFADTWRLSDGRVIAVVHTPIADGGWVSTHEDVTEREHAARKISHLAHHDPLTGLANRAHFKAEVEAALAQGAARGDSLAVLLVDLDRFKPVNDTLGHAAGDQLLQVVAARMRAEVGAGDVVARLGGDEFAILQRSRPDQHAAAVALAARLIERIGSVFDLDGRQVAIGASIGVAIAPEGGRTVGELLRAADLALYKVKGSGRNAFRVFDEGLDSEASSRCRTEAELREAIAAGALELHFQPIVAFPDESVCGMEALVRWRHPSRGLLMPDQFIALAEDTGLIVPLGEWVLRHACFEAARWPGHVRLAVNISPNHIKKRTLVRSVIQALGAARLPPERLEIEVTETVLLLHDEAILAELQQLRDLGVAVVLDDFGTGYSSLSHLRMFTFDKIKIDRLFVAEVAERPDCAAIVCAVTGLARSLGMAATAEGVETAEQARLLRAAGCTHAQGYLFGRPQPAAAAYDVAVSGLAVSGLASTATRPGTGTPPSCRAEASAR